MDTKHATRTTLFALLFSLLAAPALAGEFSAVLNGRSFHVDATEDWNEYNTGLGLEYQFATRTRWKKQLMVNGFRDSNEDMSYMVGAGLYRNLFETERFEGFYIDAGINAFLMTRRDVNDNRPFPGALPSLTIGNRYVGFNLTYLPKQAVESMYDSRVLDETMSGIIFLQFKVGVSQLLPRN